MFFMVLCTLRMKYKLYHPHPTELLCDSNDLFINGLTSWPKMHSSRPTTESTACYRIGKITRTKLTLEHKTKSVVTDEHFYIYFTEISASKSQMAQQGIHRRHVSTIPRGWKISDDRQMGRSRLQQIGSVPGNPCSSQTAVSFQAGGKADRIWVIRTNFV